MTSKSRPVDLAVLDYKQCFDTLAVDVASNDMYNAGVADDNLNLIYECDSLSKIAVKTPVGLTKRVDVEKVVAQGEVSQKLTWRTSTIIKTQYQFLHLEWLTTKSMFLTVDLTVSGLGCMCRDRTVGQRTLLCCYPLASSTHVC